MQIPHPNFNLRARELFRRIYQNRQVDIKASKNSLEGQLELYLEHIGAHIGHAVSDRDKKRIWSIIERNNQVSRIQESPACRTITKRNKEALGKVILGLVFCIDGRIPALFVGGRFARHFEVPAAEISVIKRKSDGKLIPDSTDLNESLRSAASSEAELLEVVFAHTSLLNPVHGCGAMTAKRKNGELDKNLINEEANLKIIKEKTIPAITNIYNEFREQMGLFPLAQVGIAALYDTDSFGIILNYDLGNQALSTSVLTQKYKEEINEHFVKENILFGSFREKFSDLKYLIDFSSSVLNINQNILDRKVAPNLLEEVKSYIEAHYPDLTDNQRSALTDYLIRNVSLQFLTGLCAVKKSTLDHAFAEHEESYMSVAMRGATIGKFDPESQAFSSTPADPQEAIANINVMLSIMGDSPKIKPYLLFVCNSVSSRDLWEDDLIVQRLMGSNAGLLRDIIADKKLGGMIEKGEIIPIPVLIAEDTREVLKIADHAAYI